MQFKDFLTESFKKEYGFRVKIAADCGTQHMDMIESCLQKYNLVSVASFKRTPIEENPMEFVRAKGIKLISEVCATDIVLKYPANPRILEVWLAVNLGLDHERVLVYGINEPRRMESDHAQERTEYNQDRQEDPEQARLMDEDQAHYEMQMEAEEVVEEEYGFGEAYNQKFLAELERIKAEKGADYFRNYPTKDELMGDNLRPLWDDLNNNGNMGKGQEPKHVSVNSQNLGGPL
jgi:hypothetical protein